MGSDDELLTTFEQAHQVSAYTLARRWSHSAGHERTLPYEVDELATMAALRDWMDRWLPLQVHRALAAGADVEQICVATGWTLAEVVDRWRTWSDGQKRLWQRMGRPDHTADHEQVESLLAAALRNQEGGTNGA